jgi:hypothetical protein
VGRNKVAARSEVRVSSPGSDLRKTHARNAAKNRALRMVDLMAPMPIEGILAVLGAGVGPGARVYRPERFPNLTLISINITMCY